MKIMSYGLCAAVVAGFAIAGAANPAQALTAQECSAKYQAAKTAGTLGGQKWNDFRKAQCSADATPAATTTTAAPKEAPKAAPSLSASKGSGSSWPCFRWRRRPERSVDVVRAGDDPDRFAGGERFGGEGPCMAFTDRGQRARADRGTQPDGQPSRARSPKRRIAFSTAAASADFSTAPSTKGATPSSQACSAPIIAAR